MKKYLWILFLSVVVYGCKSRLNPEAPDKEVSRIEYSPTLSKLNVPLVLKIDELKKVLNEQLTGSLYEDNSYTNNGNDNIKVFVNKNGDIDLDAVRNEIIYEVPLKCKVKGRYPMMITELRAESTFEFTVKLNTKLDVDDQWNLTTETSLVSYSLDNEPKLDFGVVSISLKGAVKLLLDNFLDDAVPVIDKQIKENLDTRKHVEDLWLSIQKPTQIDEDYDTWLKIVPKYFVYSPIKGDHKHISLNLGINGYLEVVTGKEPEYKIDTHLPDLIRKKELSDEFSISLKSEMYYYKMNEILAEEFVGYEYAYGKRKKVIVTDAQVYGNGDDLVVKISFTGNLKGDFFMTGRPKFDSETKSIYIDDLDFDIKSQQMLIKVADVLLKGTFKKQMNKYLKFSLKEQLDDTQVMIEQYLKSQQLDKTVGVDIEITKAGLDQIIMKDQSMITVLNIDGKLGIQYGK